MTRVSQHLKPRPHKFQKVLRGFGPRYLYRSPTDTLNRPRTNPKRKLSEGSHVITQVRMAFCGGICHIYCVRHRLRKNSEKILREKWRQYA